MNRIMEGLDAGIADWEEIWSNHSTERWMLAIAEESGEVIGAFNKWHNGYKHNPKTREDVLEEMSQLAGCLFLTAYKLQVSPAELLDMTGDFMAAKAQQIRKIRATLAPTLKDGDEDAGIPGSSLEGGEGR